ncbi:MAG: anthranilate phosphoribosyltransferase [Candidatus Omnitrophica bacterium]|nr:anthranilate phosphoribosyltransferase [Candidatus Omnitrophota bacterium]
MIKEAIDKLSRREDLTKDQTRSVFHEIMEGRAGHNDMKSFLTSLADKGETVDEVTQAALVMRDKMTKIKLTFDTLLDTCGTGGGASSFNVSTVVALIAAASGVKVAKHGNRSYTSHCGSADLLEHLGVKIDIAPDKTAECIKEIGIGFLFAPLYHSAMKNVAGVRREIKRRTIFNILGPLSNPAGATVQLIGTFEESLTELLARVLNNLGLKRAFVVHGTDGFDEISISDETLVSEVKDSSVSTYKIRPEDFGIIKSKKIEVACKDLDDNINTVNSILNAKKSSKREMALVNTSLALVAAGRARSFKDGVKIAAESIDSGGAKDTLEKLVRFTNG